MKKSVLALSVIAMTSLASYSQEKIEYYNSKEVIDKGNEKYYDGDYEEAYKEFIKINENDTAFYKAAFNAVLAASYMDHSDTVIDVCEKVLKTDIPSGDKWRFINAMAVAYMDKKDYNKSIEVLNDGLKEYPRNYLFYYNKAVCFEKKEMYEEAIVEYQNSIRYNPRSYKGHYKLGMLCAKMGQLTKAMLSMNMAITMNAGRKSSVNLLVKIEAVAKGEIEEEYKLAKFPEEEDFDELDLILKNKIALNKKYKYKSKLSFPFLPQTHMMMEKISYDPSNNGFWNQNYVRYFSELYKAGHFEGYSYTVCSAIKNDRIQKTVLKGKKRITNYLNWSKQNYQKMMNQRKVREGKKYVDNKLWHEGGYGFSIESDRTANGEITGDFKTYHDNGALSLKGTQGENGKGQGFWEYYYKNGNRKVSFTLVDNKLKGDRTIYYKNNTVKKVIPRDGDNIDGSITNYYPFEQVYSVVPFVNNLEEGDAQYYFRIGSKMYDVTYKEGKIQGSFKSYYANGQLINDMNYVDGKKDGEFKEYHKDGILATTGAFKEGERDGAWKWYHKNGKLKEEGQYKKGVLIGQWKEYNNKGIRVEEANYGETGKKTGVYREFDEEGNVEMELTYKGEEIIAYKYFDKKGNILSQGEKKRRELEIVGMHDNGKKSVSGKFYKAKRSGVWEYFDYNGIRTQKTIYDDKGRKEGMTTWYFTNGEVETIKHFKEGQEDGYYADFYKNGKMYAQGWFKEGNKEGRWEYYYSNGKVKNSAYYINGELNGNYDEFSVKGTLENRYRYFDGFLEEVISYDSTGKKEIYKTKLVKGEASPKLLFYNGKLANEFSYKGSVLHGVSKWYYGTGEKRIEGAYFSSDRTGKWTWYYRGGKLQSEGSYVDGDKDGEWKWYHENGQLETYGNYDRGSVEGMRKWYYPSGKLETESMYRNNKRHGATKYYDENGKVEGIRYYNEGVLIGYSYLGKDGKELAMIPFDARNGKLEMFYDNGKPSYVINFKEGYFEGEYLKYHYNGKLARKTVFENDNRTGAHVTFYSDGKPHEKFNYEYGNLSGIAEVFYKNGKLKSKENYYYGELYGWSEYYNENGTLKEKVLYENGQIVKVEK